MKVLLENRIGDGDYRIRLTEEENLHTRVKTYYIEAFKRQNRIGRAIPYTSYEDALKAYGKVSMKDE